MANLKLHTIGIHGGFHHNFLYTVVRTVGTMNSSITGYLFIFSGTTETRTHIVDNIHQ